MPKEKFIDPSVYFAQNIKNDLMKNNMLNDKFEYEKFYVTFYIPRHYESRRNDDTNKRGCSEQDGTNVQLIE